MTKTEKKILLGLYIDNPMVNRKIVYYTSELNWLRTRNRLSQVKNWRDLNGKLKKAGGELDEDENYLAKHASIQSAVEKALSYLKGKQYINYKKRDLSSFEVSVTIDGCDIARQLQTKLGRLNLWYKEHKDGRLELLFICTLTGVVLMIFVLAYLLPAISMLVQTRYELADKWVARNSSRIVYWDNVQGYSLVKNAATDKEPAILILHLKNRQRGINLPEDDDELLHKVISVVAEKVPLIKEVKPKSLHATLVNISQRTSKAD